MAGYISWKMRHLVHDVTVQTHPVAWGLVSMPGGGKGLHRIPWKTEGPQITRGHGDQSQWWTAQGSMLGW